MILRIAFYKAPGLWTDKVIRILTNGKYSHCELLFEDGRMFSSDTWHNGVRWNNNYNVDNWDMITIHIDNAQYSTLVNWCVSKENSKYDYCGVIRFLLPFVKQNPSKWFCSELCAAGLKFISIIPSKTKIDKISPQLLFEMLKKRY